MGPLNNIGNFFRKRLIETEVDEQVWNVPSDDIWMAAEPHFPKEKLNRRWFIIFFFASMFISTTIIFVYSKSNTRNTIENEKILLTHSNDKLHTESITNSESKNNQPNTINTSAMKKKVDGLFNNQVEKNVGKGTTIETNSISKSPSSENRINNIRPTEFKNESLSEASQHTKEADIVNHLSITNLLPALNENLSGFSESQGPNEELSIKNIDSSEIEGHQLLLMPSLPNQELNKLSALSSALIAQVPGQIHIKQNQNKSRWELGLALSQFNKKPEWIITDLLNEDDMYTMQSSQIGFNASISKLVSNRFSYTTGIMYNHLDFDLTILDNQNFGDEITIETLKKRIKDFVRVGNLSVNGNGRDINIEFLDENDLSKGDILNLRAEFPINLNLYQIPFILNYRYIKHKWEWNASGGMSIDLVRVRVNNINVDVSKNGISTIKPVEIEPISDTSLTGSLYIGTGFKYEVYPKLSLGLLSRVDLTDLRLSKYDFGIYYKL